MAKQVKPQKADDQASSLSAKLDRELASAAYRKVMQGEVPTARERSALKRVEKEQEEKRRWEYYTTIPKRHWQQMSGRQVKVINEQGDRYGLPLAGRVIDLPKFVRAFHNFLATNARKLAQSEDDMLAGDSSSAALEEYRRERARLARLEREEREGTLIPRDYAREGLGRIASILRTAGQTLARQFGAAAGQVLYEALDDAQREIDRTFGDTDDKAGEKHAE